MEPLVCLEELDKSEKLRLSSFSEGIVAVWEEELKSCVIFGSRELIDVYTSGRSVNR